MISADGTKMWPMYGCYDRIISRQCGTVGRSDNGQCDDHVGQREVDAIITMVSDHIIGQSHIGHFDDGQCDDHIGQCDMIGQRVMVMVSAMVTLGSDDGIYNAGQCDDHIIVTAIITPVSQCDDHFDTLLMVGVMITFGHVVNVITWSVCQ